MFFVILHLSLLIADLGFSQDISGPTLILPTSTGQSLEDTETSSRRYTVKPAVTRQKVKEAKKSEELTTNPIALEKTEPPASANPIPMAVSQEATKKSPSHLEISFAPTFIYSDFKSSYWYRNYNLTSPGLKVGTSLWINPGFGFYCSYLSTIGAEINSAPTSDSRVAVTQQWFSFGLQFREYNPESTDQQIIYGLRYTDYQFQVPLENQHRVRLKTSGPSLYLRFLSSRKENKINTFEVEISPQLKHKEIQTSVDLNSGDKVDTNAISLSLGRIYKLVNESNMYWNFKSSFEKSIFTGNANRSDPITTQTPSGVSVTNQTLMLEFGYIWSN